MITSQVTFRLLCAASFLLASSIFHAITTDAAENRHSEERIPIEHARVAQASGANAQHSRPRRRSMIAQAARGQVQQTGFLEDFGGPSCGPVCDCGNCCDADPGCGVEVYGDPGCGIEYFEEPGCGIEGYGVEPGCGIEVGCGVGQAIDVIGSALGPSCGIAGCTGCGENSCGIEEIYVDPGCGIEFTDDCSCDACSADSIPILLPLLRIEWCRFDFFAGVQGFKGPLNFAPINAANSNIRSGSGSFGFYEGFNEGRSLRRLFGWDMAAQFGVRATQSNLSGSALTEETRQQVFVTAGLFRRVDYGLQYGVVMDYLNDDWYFQGDASQIRGELSWRTATCHVYGLQYMAPLSDDSSSTLVDDGTGNLISSTINFETTDQYRLFYRRLLNGRGNWSAFAGWTDNDDGLLGANLNLPMRRNLSLSTGATFLVPREGDSSGGEEQEGWNISLGLTYHPGGQQGAGRYSRPMFDVADNGTFMLDVK